MSSQIHHPGLSLHLYLAFANIVAVLSSTDAAAAAVGEVRDFLTSSHGSKLDKIVFCSFLDKDVNAYAETLPKFFPPTKEDIEAATDASGESLQSCYPVSNPEYDTLTLCCFFREPLSIE